jgi:NADH-quinone oxidoreductase subunit C
MSEQDKTEEKRLAAEKAKEAAKAKAAAAAKAKAAAAAKAKATEEATSGEEPEPNFEPDVYKEQTSESVDQADDKAKAAAAAKAKAAAAAKAKAAAAAKAKAQAEGGTDQASTEPAGDDDKAKAAAAAKAKAAAAAKAKASRNAAVGEGGSEADEKAKAIAIAKAKAAAAAKAKASKAETTSEEEEPKQPSINQPTLDKYVKVISENIGEDVIDESYINELSKEVPTLVIKNERWFEVAQFLKHNEQLAFDYLSSLHGTDFETHMEVYAHFYSFKEKQSLAVRVKADRQEPKIASVTPIWSGADWPERESYDLLGIQFEGHPNMTRILLSDDWVGYPLRKDYEQHDEEV